MVHLLERNVRNLSENDGNDDISNKLFFAYKYTLIFYRYVVMVAMLLHALNASLTLYATFQVSFVLLCF